MNNWCSPDHTKQCQGSCSRASEINEFIFHWVWDRVVAKLSDQVRGGGREGGEGGKREGLLTLDFISTAVACTCRCG